jgi:acyl carrier protein
VEKAEVNSRIIDNLLKIFPHLERSNIPDITLIGPQGLLDSLRLVELALGLEDYAYELGFDFIWSNDKIFSTVDSIFMNLESIVNEFYSQYLNGK